jgi:hypothetical protein
MHISELIAEQQLDELSLGKKVGAKTARFARNAATGIGKTLGGIAGAYNMGKRAYQQGKNFVDPQGALQSVTQAPSPTNTQPTASPNTTVAPQPTTSQNNTPVQQPSAEPQGQEVDLDQLKQQRAARQAQGQADQQQAMQQMQATAQANQAANIKDAEIKQAADEAKAKPASQQSASDKLAIKLAASKGIRENKKKKQKAVMEFHSKFLGRMI